MHTVPVSHHLNQLQRHDEGEHHASDRQNHRVGKVLYHIENTAVPCLGRCSHLGGDVAHLSVHAVEHSGQIAENAANQDFLQPIRDGAPNSIHKGLASFRGPARGAGPGKWGRLTLRPGSP